MLSSKFGFAFYPVVRRGTYGGLNRSIRHFQSSSSVTKSQSAPQAQAVVEEEVGWSWKWKLFGASVVATFVPYVVVSTIQYDPDTRELCERLFPAQVEYLRNRVHFEKEDKERLLYVRKIQKEYQKKDMQVTIHLSGGQRIILDRVPCSTPVDELKKQYGSGPEGPVIHMELRDLDHTSDTGLERPFEDDGEQITDKAGPPPEGGAATAEGGGGGVDTTLSTPLERAQNVHSLWAAAAAAQQAGPAAGAGFGTAGTKPDSGLAKEEVGALLELLGRQEAQLKAELRSGGLRAVDDVREELAAVRRRRRELRRAGGGGGGLLGGWFSSSSSSS